jgi:hypothetical protein
MDQDISIRCQHCSCIIQNTITTTEKTAFTVYLELEGLNLCNKCKIKLFKKIDKFIKYQQSYRIMKEKRSFFDKGE